MIQSLVTSKGRRWRLCQTCPFPERSRWEIFNAHLLSTSLLPRDQFRSLTLTSPQRGKRAFCFSKVPSQEKKAGNKRKPGSKRTLPARPSRDSRAACWEPCTGRLRRGARSLRCCAAVLREAGRGRIPDREWDKRVSERAARDGEVEWEGKQRVGGLVWAPEGVREARERGGEMA